MAAYAVRLESGPWLSTGTPLDAEAVAARLRDASRSVATAARPYCVYVHIPFCRTICSFCALYTRAVPEDADDVMDEYVECVKESLRTHPWRGREAPTTVHFGGGTPLLLGLERFADVVSSIRSAFGDSTSCEWAIETTTSSLDDETVACLKALGFSRVHLGIQTLDDATRARVGRRESGATAVERIRALEAQGFFTSIDLIIGFDGIGTAVVADDLRRLHEAGVRMFSICELRERGVIRLGVRDADAKAREMYEIWRTIWTFMESAGLRPIHIGQFARAQAENLYFTHPARGEDCVAIGPYSHGSCGHLYYSNKLLPEYYHAIRRGHTPIDSGIEYDQSGRLVRELERELLAHQLSAETLDRVAAAFPDAFPQLLERWIASGLVASRARDVMLTLDGSWFVGNMVFDARHLAERAVAAHAGA
jgi:coproporphyrinogen III oxidase-like Fe-S oxidoreductase